MVALYILLGIVLFFIVVFSIPLTLIVDYGEKTLISLKWLFLKIPLFDSSKEKKEKKTKKDKKPKKKKNEEKTPAKKKKKGKNGNGLLKQVYIDQGYDGLEKMLRALGKSLSGFFAKIYKTFTIDEFYITMITVGSDAADTALKYGKLCSWVYLVLGKLLSTCKVKKYDFDISPDFLAEKPSGEAYLRFHLIPIIVTNATVVLAVQLVFKVLFKILFAKKKSDKSKETTGNINNTKVDTTEVENKENTTINNKEGASK